MLFKISRGHLPGRPIGCSLRACFCHSVIFLPTEIEFRTICILFLQGKASTCTKYDGLSRDSFRRKSKTETDRTQQIKER